ncbi:MAG: signal peptidase II [Alphaproteobacteria bacterium]|nr:signal peptidase II [Alphaproteobacteria bacterium]
MNMKVLGPAIVALTAIVDQLSKWAVLEKKFRPHLGLGDPMRFADWLHDAPDRLSFISRPICSMFNLTMVWNEGISFGFLQTGGWGFLTIAGLAITGFFAFWMMKAKDTLEVLGIALIVGGALGNIFDRIRFGAVADFIDIYWKNWHFPAFNVADAAISVGVFILIVQSLFFAKNSA